MLLLRVMNENLIMSYRMFMYKTFVRLCMYITSRKDISFAASRYLTEKHLSMEER